MCSPCTVRVQCQCVHVHAQRACSALVQAFSPAPAVEASVRARMQSLSAMSERLTALVSSMRCLSWPFESAARSEPARSMTISTPGHVHQWRGAWRVRGVAYGVVRGVCVACAWRGVCMIGGGRGLSARLAAAPLGHRWRSRAGRRSGCPRRACWSRYARCSPCARPGAGCLAPPGAAERPRLRVRVRRRAPSLWRGRAG